MGHKPGSPYSKCHLFWNGMAMDRRRISPAYWRALAEEARVFAEAMTDARWRLYMLSAAQTYERLAEFAEEESQPRITSASVLERPSASS
jgi:hypothetical protein